jgi:glucans biosynthesis protein C
MQPTQRLFFLDWLRIVVFGLLVFFHVGMYYVTWAYHVKSPFASKALEPWMMLSSPWRMSVLFLIAGAASALMFQRPENTVTESALRQRTRRLLLPLLCGVLLVIPPQTYFEVVHRFDFQGSFFDFLRLYYSGYRGFCEAGKCLKMPTWNHLWFLPYLWLYTCVLWLWLRFQPQGLARIANRLPITAALTLPFFLLLALRFTLHGQFPSTYDVVHDWFNHAQYILMFLMGALFVQRRDLWETLAAKRLYLLSAALLSWAALILSYKLREPLTERIFFVSQQWCAALAALGYAKQYWNRDHRWLAQLSEAVFPVYIFHQTWIILLTQVFLPLKLKPLLEGSLIILLTFSLSWLSYLIVRRLKWFSICFGVKNHRIHTTS